MANPGLSWGEGLYMFSGGGQPGSLRVMESKSALRTPEEMLNIGISWQVLGLPLRLIEIIFII